MTQGKAADMPPLSEPWICLKCTGVRGTHYLTCPTLLLGPGPRWEENSGE